MPNFLFLLQNHDLGSRSKHDDHGGSKGQTLCTSQVCSKVFSYLSKQGHKLFLTLISDNEFWKQRKAIKTFAKRTCLQSDDEYNLSTCVKVSYQKKVLAKGHCLLRISLNTKCCCNCNPYFLRIFDDSNRVHAPSRPQYLRKRCHISAFSFSRIMGRDCNAELLQHHYFGGSQDEAAIQQSKDAIIYVTVRRRIHFTARK